MDTENSQQSWVNPFFINLENFEGPLDLLLHLVKKNELPIELISLSKITNQYLAAIQSISDISFNEASVNEIDLDIAGEYLVIAAVLISIKSNTLINERNGEISDDDALISSPHEELLMRLRAAAIYKDGATFLSRRNILGVDVFENTSPYNEILCDDTVENKHDTLMLIKTFKRMLSLNKGDVETLRFSVDRVSIKDRMSAIINLLSKVTSGGRKFSEILYSAFQGNRFAKPNKGSLINTFLAILELSKIGVVDFEQDNFLDDFTVYLSGERTDIDEIAELESVNE